MAPRPFNLIAELSYRCPLRCPYCSNPLNYAEVRETLDAEAWGQVMREASAMGVVHVGLTGGEPTVRTDLDEIVAAAADAQLFTHLVVGWPVYLLTNATGGRYDDVSNPNPDPNLDPDANPTRTLTLTLPLRAKVRIGFGLGLG